MLGDVDSAAIPARARSSTASSSGSPRVWHAAGLTSQVETVHEGIDRSLDAFNGLFTGDNLGRTLVKLG